MKLRSPIGYFGGKGNMTGKIIPMIPEHRHYVEVFGGGGSVLFAKPPSLLETYNDLDSTLVQFFMTLADPDKYEIFKRRVECLPVSREIKNTYQKTWKTLDGIDKIVAWYYVQRHSFSGYSGWSYNVGETCKGIAKACGKWLSALDMLPEIHARLQRVQIENNDFRKILKSYDRPETFFYLDPPYLPSTRRSGGYNHEMTFEDHVEMIEILKNIKGKVLLSGYPNELYESLGWRKKEFATTCHVCNKKGEGDGMKNHARTEVLWYNYSLDNKESKTDDMFATPLDK